MSRPARTVSAALRHNALPFVALAALFFGSLLLLPLADGHGFGGDEGMEIQKAYLVTKGYALYGDIWCDQPPLSTYILSCLVRLDPSSLFYPRLYSVLAAALLIFSLCYLASRVAGPIAGLAAGIALISVPAFLPLSCAIMQEIPTVALGTLAILFALADTAFARRVLFPLATACALHVKLTAILFVAPAALGFAVTELNHTGRAKSLKTVLGSLLLLVFFWASIAALLGFGTPQQMFGTHLNYANAPAAMQAQIRTATPNFTRDFLPLVDIVLGGLVGLVLSLRRRRDPIVWTFWAVMAAQISLTLIYRPWWLFYIIGLMVPLCFFYGICIGRLFRTGFSFQVDKPVKRWRHTVGRIACVALIIQACFLPLSRWSNNFYELTRIGRLHSDPAVSALLKLKDRQSFILTEDGLRSYAAGLASPPELAVVSIKRWWSGQIDFDKMFEVVERRRIRAALVMNDNAALLEPRLLALGFVETYHDSNFAIYERE